MNFEDMHKNHTYSTFDPFYQYYSSRDFFFIIDVTLPALELIKDLTDMYF